MSDRQYIASFRKKIRSLLKITGGANRPVDVSSIPGLYEKVADILESNSIDGYFYYDDNFEYQGRKYNLFAQGGPDIGVRIECNELGEYTLTEPVKFETGHTAVNGTTVNTNYWELPGMLSLLQKIVDENYDDTYGGIYFDDTITYNGKDFRFFMYTDSRDPHSGLLEYLGPHIEAPMPKQSVIVPKNMAKKRS